MFQVEQSREFAEWLDSLRDRRAQLKITQRILRLQGGNPGDWKSLTGGIAELRIDHGPGYRVYYTIRDKVIYLLLCGSDKQGQERAINLARKLANKN